MIDRLSVAAIALLFAYLYRKVSHKRLQQYANFPQHPPSRVLGHLQVFDEFMKKIPRGGHADMAFAAMHRALGRPPVMLVDLRPVASCMLVVANYEVAEQIARSSDRFPYSPPKVPEIWKHLEYLTGPKSIISAEDNEWKTLRKRFNPGFAPQHLMKLLPSILDKVSLFLDHLDRHVATGEEFSLQSHATDLTFDIIGRVALDFDMDAQTAHPTEFMRRFRILIQTYAGDHLDLPWWCTPWTDVKRRKTAGWVRKTLRAMVHQRHAEGRRGGSSRSILSMSLQDIDSLTPEIVDVTCDQLTSFLFAGHDTTSTLMSWAFYELSRTPHALHAVRAELDQLLGPDSSPSAVRARLLAPGGEELIYRMSYTMAVLKETLRLWPPGATSRMTKPGTGFTINTPETGDLCIDGQMVYFIHPIIQRDPAVFGETADQFVPERWLDKPDKIPTGAWRAFERGPRSCIGQELATIEARVLIALVVRRYDFTKVGLGAVGLDENGEAELDNCGQKKVTADMYMTREVTSKPADGMRMKVKFA
ncbi:cytochrome P450 52A11 [Rhypophila sp. PSN 637]